jgi:hypothetical protein
MGPGHMSDTWYDLSTWSTVYQFPGDYPASRFESSADSLMDGGCAWIKGLGTHSLMIGICASSLSVYSIL